MSTHKTFETLPRDEVEAIFSKMDHKSRQNMITASRNARKVFPFSNVLHQLTTNADWRQSLMHIIENPYTSQHLFKSGKLSFNTRITLPNNQYITVGALMAILSPSYYTIEWLVSNLDFDGTYDMDVDLKAAFPEVSEFKKHTHYVGPVSGFFIVQFLNKVNTREDKRNYLKTALMLLDDPTIPFTKFCITSKKYNIKVEDLVMFIIKQDKKDLYIDYQLLLKQKSLPSAEVDVLNKLISKKRKDYIENNQPVMTLDDLLETRMKSIDFSKLGPSFPKKMVLSQQDISVVDRFFKSATVDELVNVLKRVPERSFPPPIMKKLVKSMQYIGYRVPIIDPKKVVDMDPKDYITHYKSSMVPESIRAKFSMFEWLWYSLKNLTDPQFHFGYELVQVATAYLQESNNSIEQKRKEVKMLLEGVERMGGFTDALLPANHSVCNVDDCLLYYTIAKSEEKRQMAKLAIQSCPKGFTDVLKRRIAELTKKDGVFCVNLLIKVGRKEKIMNIELDLLNEWFKRGTEGLFGLSLWKYVVFKAISTPEPTKKSTRKNSESSTMSSSTQSTSRSGLSSSSSSKSTSRSS